MQGLFLRRMLWSEQVVYSNLQGLQQGNCHSSGMYPGTAWWSFRCSTVCGGRRKLCLSKEELERQRWKICADNWHWFLYFCAIYFLRIDSLKIWQEIPMAAYFNDVNKTKPSIEEVTARTFVLWHEQDGKEELRKVYENSIYPYYNKQTRMMQEYACFFFTSFIWWL